MNLYVVLASTIGNGDATTLGARLSSWHDAMVAHERVLRTRRTTTTCDDECPHAEAPALWNEALETFGDRAHELAFLRERAARAVPERPYASTRWKREAASRQS